MSTLQWRNRLRMPFCLAELPIFKRFLLMKLCPIKGKVKSPTGKLAFR